MGAATQPSVGSQLSLVQGLASLHRTGLVVHTPAAHAPAWQGSFGMGQSEATTQAGPSKSVQGSQLVPQASQDVVPTWEPCLGRKTTQLPSCPGVQTVGAAHVGLVPEQVKVPGSPHPF